MPRKSPPNRLGHRVSFEQCESRQLLSVTPGVLPPSIVGEALSVQAPLSLNLDAGNLSSSQMGFLGLQGSLGSFVVNNVYGESTGLTDFYDVEPTLHARGI